MNPKDLRIVYMGTPEFAVAPLKALVEGGYNVVAVATMPDKPAGRGLKMQESAVKQYAVSAGLPVLQPEKLKDERFVEEFRNLAPDLGIVVAFRMLPEVIWDAPRLGTFNLHASLLPQYRGAAPINWAIIDGGKKTGVTTFFLNKGMDTGEIIDRREVDILLDDNAGTLHDKLMSTGAALVVDTVDKIGQGGYATEKQESIAAGDLRPAPKIFKDTCHIDFSKSGIDIVNLVRGLSPYPAAWAELAQHDAAAGDPVKIFKAEYEPAETGGRKAGEVLSDGKSYMKAVCGDGYVNILELQPAGKKRMTVGDYLRGVRRIYESSFR